MIGAGSPSGVGARTVRQPFLIDPAYGNLSEIMRRLGIERGAVGVAK